MSNVRSRVNKLEAKVRGKSGKHFLHLSLEPEQSKQEAIEQAMNERGITLSDVGYVIFPNLESIDFGGYEDMSSLIGFAEFSEMLRNLPPTLGPPSER